MIASPRRPLGPAVAPAGGRLSLTVAGLLITLLLAALDATIVATATPRIVDEMHALDRYTWITTAYLLTSTLAVPVVGKLADQYGRKVFLVAGTLLFVLASLLCGLAASWWELVGARALQGVGAGVVTAAVFAAVPSLFSATDRARIIGLFTGTYGLASIVGPLLGGLVTDAVGWRGVFAINVPVGLVALALLLATYPGSRPRATDRPVVDYLGAATLVAGITPLLLVLSLGGHDLAWTSPTTAGLLVVSLLALAVFVRVERRATQPIIPLELLSSRGLGIAALGMALMASGLFATSLFTPLFVQGVGGQSSTRGGAILAPMMLAWVLASVVVGQLIARFGRTRYTAVGGMAVAAFGLWLMASLDAAAPYALLARDLVVIGLGLGAALSSFAVAAQNAVAVEQTGVATALSTFARAIGSTVTSAALGGLLAARLGASSLQSVPPTVLADALHTTFLAAMAIVVVGAVVALALRERPFRSLAAEHLTAKMAQSQLNTASLTQGLDHLTDAQRTRDLRGRLLQSGRPVRLSLQRRGRGLPGTGAGRRPRRACPHCSGGSAHPG